jgi:succinyl-CoA synthetase beta subunit
MKLYEHHAKKIIARYGIPIPKGVIVANSTELNKLQSTPGAMPQFPWALKAQVLVGGRGKAGGIKFVSNIEDAFRELNGIIGMDIHGCKVTQVLVEEKLNIRAELYVGFIVMRSIGMPMLLASAEGGMEIEAVPEHKIFKVAINPLIGIQPFMLRRMCNLIKLAPPIATAVTKITVSLYKLFCDYDAELVELNPLVITEALDVVAADAKLIIDDDALYRHTEFIGMEQARSKLEQRAYEKGIAFVQLDGNIGVIANGAGLTMATLDLLKLAGGSPGVFLDLGGGADPNRVREAFNIMKDANPKVILLNIFGGITRCDEVAIGIKEALEHEPLKIPVVVRIKGTNEDEACKILKNMGFVTATTLEEAAKYTVKLANTSS